MTGAVRPSTPGRKQRGPDRRQRGTIYILVLAVAANLLVIGLAAVLLFRVRMRGVHRDEALREARRLSYSGVEQAIAMMNNYTGGTGVWRNDFTNDVETTPVAFGDGQMSFKLVDEDGDLADDETDAVWIYGIGRVRDAVWVERARARVDQGLPLEFLRTALHSRGQLTVQDGVSLTVVSAPASTDGSLLLEGTLAGDVEASSQSGSGSVMGTRTVPAEKKGLPPVSVFEAYKSRATALTFSGDPTKVVLTPELNQYDESGVNADGVYYIETGGSDLSLNMVRLHGTLVVDVGAGELWVQQCLIESYREDFPALLVKGSLRLDLVDPMPESSPVDYNFNPSGAAYKGQTDDDQTDSYPSGIFGLVHVIGDATLANGGASQGTMVVDGRTTVGDNTQLTHDPDLMYNPPLGYADDPNSRAMVIRSGSWSRQAAP